MDSNNDSDSDFSDIGEEDVNNEEVNLDSGPRLNKNGVKVRGADKSWVESHRFATANDFKESEIAQRLDKEFSMRKTREYDYADVLEYDCKFSRRVGFLPCPWKMKVAFLSHNSEVTVETIEGVDDHIHEEETPSANSSSTFKWSDEMTKVVKEWIHAKPNFIKRKLKDLGCKMPTQTQLYNKMAATKKIVFPSSKVSNTHQLRMKVAEFLEEPESDLEAFVPYHEIVDDDETSDPRFTIIFTTKKNLRKLKSERVLQTDATYRLNWNGFPVFVVGTSSPTGRFFASCVVLASHEDSPAWATIYKFIYDRQINPNYLMGDGAKAITKACNTVFTDHKFTRLMCWAHVHSNLLPQLRSVSAHSKPVSDSILQDIVNLQWSALNESSFHTSFKLLEQKYLNKYDTILNGAVAKYFSYMRKVWIDCGESKWYEGAHPFHISNNQGVEGKNREIKQSHTFRKRLEIGDLVAVLARMVSEWSEEDDHLLESSRSAALENQRNSLSLKTDGYQWYKVNKKGTDKILRINPKDKYTVSESSDFLLGKVTNLWAVNSSEGEKCGKSLKERAKERLAHRKVPLSEYFDDYIRIRSSCWIVEEVDGEFYCDCPIGMKGKLCKHCVGLMYMNGILEVTSDVRSVPLGQKRKRGRPKNIPNCLVKSPVIVRNEHVLGDDGPPPLVDDDFDYNDEDIPEDVHIQAEALPVRKTTRKRKRAEVEVQPDDGLQDVQQSPVASLLEQSHSLRAGLGCSKPPKKSRRTKPATNEPQPSKPQPGEPQPGKPQASKPLPSKPLPSKPQPSKSQPNKTQPSKHQPSKPQPIKCKKKAGSCKHEIVFNEHFDKKSWDLYADSVRRKKSSTVIDPDYVS